MPLSRSVKQLLQDRVSNSRRQAMAPKPRAFGGPFAKNLSGQRRATPPQKSTGVTMGKQLGGSGRTPPPRGAFGAQRGQNKPAFGKPAPGAGYGRRYAQARAQRDQQRQKGTTARRFGGREGAMPRGAMRSRYLR